MDRVQAMAAFVAVVDSGGFASAARKLGVSAPVVTRAVAELESRLGVKLLLRNTRQVRVTSAGAAFAEDTRRILAALQEAEDAASGTRAAARGTLAVTAPVLFGGMHLIPIVVQYLRELPEVDVQCLFSDRVVNLLDESIDVAVRIGDLPDSSLHAIPVGAVRRVLVAAPGYLAVHGTPVVPQDLTRHTLIAATGVSALPEWRFDIDGKSHVQRIQARLRTNTNDAAVTAALAGFGIARLLSYQVAEHLQRGDLQRVLPEFETSPVPVHVIHHDGQRAMSKVRRFVDLAVGALRAATGLR